MKKLLCAAVVAVFCIGPAQAQMVGFGFEFYNYSNIMDLMQSSNPSMSQYADVMAPMVYFDINIEDLFRVEPMIGLMLGDGAGNNGMMLNGGLGVFGLVKWEDKILNYYGVRGGLKPWVIVADQTPSTYWFMSINMGGEYIMASRFSIGIEAGLKYNDLDDEGGSFSDPIDLHYITTEAKIMLRFYMY
jgi:hypothetical protein